MLYVRNLSPSTSEEQLRELFAAAVSGCAAPALWNLAIDSSPAGFPATQQSPITKVKVICDNAFVHFETREQALAAQRVLDSTIASSSTLIAHHLSTCTSSVLVSTTSES